MNWTTSVYPILPTITGSYTSGSNGSLTWVKITSSGTVTF